MTTTTPAATRHGLVLFFGSVLVASVASGLLAWWLGNDELAAFAVVSPAIAAAVVTHSRGQRLRSLRGNRASWKSIAGALALFPVLGIISTAVYELAGADILQKAELSDPVPAIVAIVAIAIGEEFGWRGFALPQLLSLTDPVRASLVLGVSWWGWHVPASLLGVGTPIGINIAGFAAFVVPVAFVFTMYHLRTLATSVAIALHVGLNLANAFTPILPESIGGDTGPFWLFTSLVAGTAIALTVRSSRQNRTHATAP